MFIENKTQLMEALMADKANAGIGSSLRDKLRQLFFPSYSYKFVRLLRKYGYYHNHDIIIAKYYQFRLLRMQKALGFYIPKDVFGPGLYIPHFGSIIVNPHAIIGENCQINNNVVIGQQGGKAPVIGDNVYIGPGAVISGDVHIASNVWIGANAVVTCSFDEEYVLIAGVPAKIVARKKNNWLDERDSYA